MSFVCEHVVQTLQLPRVQSRLALTGIGAQKQTQTRGTVRLILRHWIDPTIKVSVEAHVLSRITGRVPSQPINPDRWKHLSDLQLADPQFNVPGSVDVLLGADIYGHLLFGGLRKAGRDTPVAQLTSLGWIISGPIFAETWKNPRLAHRSLSFSDQDLHQCVQDF